MTPRARILAGLRGQAVDRIPWSPFLAYWWEAQSGQIQKMGQLRFMESIGADPMLRGFGAAWQVKYDGVERSVSERAGIRREILVTPVGSLESVYRYSPTGDTWFLVDHPVRTLEDLNVGLSIILYSEASEHLPGRAPSKRAHRAGVAATLEPS